MNLTNLTGKQFLITKSVVLAPWQQALVVADADYAADRDLRFQINRISGSTEISFASTPVGFPDWTGLDQPAAGPKVPRRRFAQRL